MDPSPGFSLSPLAVAVAIVFVLLAVLLVYFRFLRQTANTLLIVGLSDAGKTVLFSRLVGKDVPLTYTSWAENVFEAWTGGNGGDETEGKPIRVVDCPGAERLRPILVNKWLGSELPSLRRVVFVVDSTTCSRRARDVAELLYDVLVQLSNRRIPLLVACNKQDDELAKSDTAIRTQLEKEFALIEKSRAAALETTDGDATGAKQRLRNWQGQSPSFDTSGVAVHFLGCSATDKNDKLAELRTWCRA